MKKKNNRSSEISDKEFRELLKEIVTLLNSAVKKFRDAGKIIVRLVETNKFTLRYIHRECPALSIAKLTLLERIGRNDFHPVLMLPGNAGESMLVQMAYADQVAAIDKGEPVIVATMEPDGTFGTTMLPATSLTIDQVNQVSRMVKGKRVYVSIEEQQAWLVDHRTNIATRPSGKKGKPKWVIVDGCAVIGGIRMTKADLAAALNDLHNPPHHLPDGP